MLTPWIGFNLLWVLTCIAPWIIFSTSHSMLQKASWKRFWIRLAAYLGTLWGSGVCIIGCCTGCSEICVDFYDDHAERSSNLPLTLTYPSLRFGLGRDVQVPHTPASRSSQHAVFVGNMGDSPFRAHFWSSICGVYQLYCRVSFCLYRQALTCVNSSCIYLSIYPEMYLSLPYVVMTFFRLFPLTRDLFLQVLSPVHLDFAHWALISYRCSHVAFQLFCPPPVHRA